MDERHAILDPDAASGIMIMPIPTIKVPILSHEFDTI
jgi:hypothetical protein